MPKGRRNKAGDRRMKEVAGSEEDSTSDNTSVTSSVSDAKSAFEDGGGNEQDVVEEATTEWDNFEDKIKDAIEGATQKSAKGRQICLEGIGKAFTMRYLYDFIAERKMTITDCIERSLKKGKGEEQDAAAMLAIIVCIQLGAGDESEEVFRNLQPILHSVATDNSVSPKARAKCFTALGVCSFITGNDSMDFQDVLSSLESAFGTSYLKGNGSVPIHTAEMTAIHSSALAAWALLLTVMAPSELYNMVETHLYRLPELLDSSDVELRITAGETIALFYEIVREFDEDFDGDDLEVLCEKLKQLATDSQKYRAKKERKQQRSSFRDILKAVEDKESPTLQVKFGREVLTIDNWSRKRQYDAFCQVLGSGMNLHLTGNCLLRDIFGLGSPLATGGHVQKISKFERHMVNSAAFKARTIQRSKFRDKRTAVF